MPDVWRFPRDRADRARQFKDRRGHAGADVERRRNFRTQPHGRQQRGDNVGNVHEVPGLFAVAVNGGGPALDQALQKDRQDAGVDARRILPRPKHVEEPQGYGLQSKTVGKYARIVLAQELLNYVDRDAPLFRSCREMMYEAGEPLLARAQEAGAVRPDTNLSEVIQMVGGIAKIQGVDPAQIDHILDIALDGLRYRE